ncbi:MAG TPA: hypothetical protein PLG50_04215 [bacterium]|nr:hypothetical protein [bacterium]
MNDNSEVTTEALYQSLKNQAINAGKSGDMQGVIELFRDRIAAKNLPLDSRRQVGVIIMQLAGVARRSGDQLAASQGYEEAAQYFREADDKRMLQTALSGATEALMAIGDNQHVLPLVAEHVKICREMGDQNGLLNCLAIQGKLLYWAGDSEHAAELAEQSEALARELGREENVAITLSNRGLLLISQNDLEQAQGLLDEAERLLRKGSNRQQLANTIGGRAIVLMQRGEYTVSLSLQQEAAGICRELGDVEGLAKALTMQALLHSQMGDPGTGVPIVKEADQLARAHGLTALVDGMIAPVMGMLGANSDVTASSLAPTALKETSTPPPAAAPAAIDISESGYLQMKPSAFTPPPAVAPAGTMNPRLAAWQNLPWYKRLRTPKPEPSFCSDRSVASFDLQIPSLPPIPVEEVRMYMAQQFPGIIFDGTYPIYDLHGQFLCKNCGLPLEKGDLNQTLEVLKQAIIDPTAHAVFFHLNCRKCTLQSFFSPKEVLSRQPGNALGPWNKTDIRTAKTSLEYIFNLSPIELAGISASHFDEVMYLYS